MSSQLFVFFSAPVVLLSGAAFIQRFVCCIGSVKTVFDSMVGLVAHIEFFGLVDDDCVLDIAFCCLFFFCFQHWACWWGVMACRSERLLVSSFFHVLP